MPLDYSRLFALQQYRPEIPNNSLYEGLAGIANTITANRESGLRQENIVEDRKMREATRAQAQANADRGYGLDMQRLDLARDAASRAEAATRRPAFHIVEDENGQKRLIRTTPDDQPPVDVTPAGSVPSSAPSGAPGAFQPPPGVSAKTYRATAAKNAADVDHRRATALSLGLDPNAPHVQSFILSGRMPREDQQPLTATDKKAILEADEGVLAAETAIGNLQQAKELSKRAYAGPLAGARGYAGSLVGAEGSTETTDLNNLVMTNALGQLKSIFGGNPTEGERKILLDIQGSANQPNAVRQTIYDRAIGLANKRLEFNRQRANEMRGGTFYKQGGGTPAVPSSGAGQPPSSGNQPNQSAIEALRANPRLAEQFDAKYGVGMAARILGVLR